MRRTMLLMIMLLGTVLPAACAAEGDLAGATAANLAVAVDEGDGEVSSATLTCAGPGEGDGTAWLADEAAADRACDAVLDNSGRLIEGPPADAICTEQYGGPQTAQVTGTVGEDTVDTEFHRRDGCGISDWQTFEVLLGISGGVEPEPVGS